MLWGSDDCRRFRRMVSEAEDRALIATENEFMSQHRVACAACADAERTAQNAWNVLRQASLEGESNVSFDARVIRRLKVQQVKEGFAHWTPALTGATLASVVVLTAVHLINRPTPEPSRELIGTEASRVRASGDLPDLTLRKFTAYLE